MKRPVVQEVKVGTSVPRLTDVLIDMGIDASKVHDAAERYYQFQEARFGEYLIKEGIIDFPTLSLALARQEVARGRTANADNLLKRAHDEGAPTRNRSTKAVQLLHELQDQLTSLQARHHHKTA